MYSSITKIMTAFSVTKLVLMAGCGSEMDVSELVPTNKLTNQFFDCVQRDDA